MPRVAQHEIWRDGGHRDVGNDPPHPQRPELRQRSRYGNDCRRTRRSTDVGTLTPKYLPTTWIPGRGTTADLRPNAKVERRAATSLLALYSRRVRSNVC
jgi:hypothetical protein